MRVDGLRLVVDGRVTLFVGPGQRHRVFVVLMIQVGSLSRLEGFLVAQGSLYEHVVVQRPDVLRINGKDAVNPDERFVVFAQLERTTAQVKLCQGPTIGAVQRFAGLVELAQQQLAYPL